MRGSAVLAASAERRGLEVRRLGPITIEVVTDRSVLAFDGLSGPADSVATLHVCNRSDQLRSLLADAGLPVPHYSAFRVDEVERARSFATDLGPTCVLRPRLSSSPARRVVLDDDIDRAWRVVEAKYVPTPPRPVNPVAIVESSPFPQMVAVTVVDGSVAAAAHGIPATVVGDGAATVRDLIRRANRRRKRIGLPPIPLRRSRLAGMRRAALELDSIPSDGETLVLRGVTEGAAGLTWTDIAGRLHGGLEFLARRAVDVVPGLGQGIVYVSVDDLSLEPRAQRVAIHDIDFSVSPLPAPEPPDEHSVVADAVLGRALRHAAGSGASVRSATGIRRLQTALRRRSNADRGYVLAEAERIVQSREVADLAGEGANLKSALLEWGLRRRAMPVGRIDHRVVATEHAGRRILFDEMNGPNTAIVGRRICDRKEQAIEVLRRAGLPVARSQAFEPDQLELGQRFAETLGGRVVVKPTSLSHGRGITLGIGTPEQFTRAWQGAVEAARALGRSQRLLVEEHVDGLDVRVFVVGSRAISATSRRPANVVGDGRATIRELIDYKNEIRRRDPYLGLSPIPSALEYLEALVATGGSLDDVPEDGARVSLRSVSNVSAGGESFDVTDQVDPALMDVAVRAVAAIPGLRYGGVDLLVAPRPSDGAVFAGSAVVTEVNYAADPMSTFSWRGPSYDMAGAVLDDYGF
ncbi:ATP-binding protein [Ilumatobacter nonamiensis]|uniref:ATP-binding protein n=1 Tax=Ilumatobacter nonamiensis TaxID=467093 RepID=UPI0011D28220|nr:hypothetical protein [Ilumatobacter nonamiensis]